MRNDQDGFDMFIEPINPQIYEGNAEARNTNYSSGFRATYSQRLSNVITIGVTNDLVPTKV